MYTGREQCRIMWEVAAETLVLAATATATAAETTATTAAAATGELGPVERDNVAGFSVGPHKQKPRF